ncbi:MAG: hypothetical protein QXD03_01345 [Candidatus Anstonellales archaeon]
MYFKIDKDRTYIRIDTANDLWYIWNLIGPGDIVESTSLRSVEGMDQKKPVRIKLEVERIKYMKDIHSVRLTGKIIDGSPSEYIQLGRYHSFDIRKDSELYVYKDWSEYERELLNDALKNSRELIANVVLIDERNLKILNLYPIGMEIILERDLPYSKMSEENRDRIYSEIAKSLISKKIIIAGPGFEKEKLANYLKSDYDILAVLSVSYAEISSLKELFPQIRDIIAKYRIQQDLEIVGILNQYIAKYSEMIVFGEDIKNYAEGNLELVCVIDDALESKETRDLLKTIEKYGTKIYIFSSESPYAETIKMLKTVGIRRY